MKNKIFYSPKAQEDLDAIWDYIEKDLCNPMAAQHTVDGIMDQIDILADFPEYGPKLTFENGLETGYRFVLYKNYIAFYRFSPEQVIFVDRVLYAGRDYMRILFPELRQ